MEVIQNIWQKLVGQRRPAIVILVVMALIAAPPAQGQFQLIAGLVTAVSSGLTTVANVITTINNTLNNVIRPILQSINSAISAAQQIMGAIFDFQRNVIYPEQSIDQVRALIGQIAGIYNGIRGIWATAVRSATLPQPRNLEDLILSKDVGRIPQLGAAFAAVYAPLPALTDAHAFQRDVVDSRDAAAQAAMKRSVAIDAIADQELLAAEQMMNALRSTAPGTAEMIGAQAGAWLVRSQAYTQQAMAELMRLRAIDLAAHGAVVKEGARYARESRSKVIELNR